MSESTKINSGPRHQRDQQNGLYNTGVPSPSESYFGTFNSDLVQHSFGFFEEHDHQFPKSNIDLPTPPHSPHFLSAAEYQNSGSPYSAALSERVFFYAADLRTRNPSSACQKPKPSKACKERFPDGVPCPFKKYGCASKILFTNYKIFKKHLQNHGIGEVYQCIDVAGDEPCLFATKNRDRIDEHCNSHKSDAKEVRQRLLWLKVFPNMLRCEGCSEIFVHQLGAETHKFQRTFVPDDKVGRIPLPYVARISHEETALREWFTHVISCDAPRALPEDGTPGENSLLFFWAKYFRMMSKTITSKGQATYRMPFDANRGRTTTEQILASQLMYAKILAHQLSSPNLGESAMFKMQIPLAEFNLDSHDDVMQQIFEQKDKEDTTPLRTYLKKTLPGHVFEEFIYYARVDLYNLELTDLPANMDPPTPPPHLSRSSSPALSLPSLSYSPASSPESSFDSPVRPYRVPVLIGSSPDLFNTDYVGEMGYPEDMDIADKAVYDIEDDMMADVPLFS